MSYGLQSPEVQCILVTRNVMIGQQNGNWN